MTAIEESSTTAPKLKISGTSLPYTVKSAAAKFPSSSITVIGALPLPSWGMVMFVVKAPSAPVTNPPAGVTFHS